jgi:hypothetical protein
MAMRKRLALGYSAPALVLGLILASCATMTPDECRLANWHEIGLSDGVEGKTLAKFTARKEDCAEAHVVPDSRAYLAGREAGLTSFCRLENAAPLGVRGDSYEGVCPPLIDGEFRRRFQIGHAVYEWRGEVSRIDERLRSQEKKLRESDRDEDKALKDVSKDEERKRIRREFDERRHRIREDLRDLDHQLHRARDNLRDAEGAMAELR